MWNLPIYWNGYSASYFDTTAEIPSVWAFKKKQTINITLHMKTVK